MSTNNASIAQLHVQRRARPRGRAEGVPLCRVCLPASCRCRLDECDVHFPTRPPRAVNQVWGHSPHCPQSKGPCPFAIPLISTKGGSEGVIVAPQPTGWGIATWIRGSPAGNTPLAGVSGGVPLISQNTPRAGGWEDKHPCCAWRQRPHCNAPPVAILISGHTANVTVLLQETVSQRATITSKRTPVATTTWSPATPLHAPHHQPRCPAQSAML